MSYWIGIDGRPKPFEGMPFFWENHQSKKFHQTWVPLGSCEFESFEEMLVDQTAGDKLLLPGEMGCPVIPKKFWRKWKVGDKFLWYSSSWDLDTLSSGGIGYIDDACQRKMIYVPTDTWEEHKTKAKVQPMEICPKCSAAGEVLGMCCKCPQCGHIIWGI